VPIYLRKIIFTISNINVILIHIVIIYYHWFPEHWITVSQDQSVPPLKVGGSVQSVPPSYVPRSSSLDRNTGTAGDRNV